MATNPESISAAADTARSFPRWLVAALAIAVIIADQVSKAVVARTIPEHTLVTVIPGFLNLTHTTNTGVAFGLFSDSPAAWKTALLTSISLGLLWIVLYLVWRSKHLDWASGLGLAMILGGALSNLADRIRTGAVVDFVDAYFRSYHWYTFNLADSAIVVGAFFLVIHLFKSE
ncbi:MAG: signal peptidase II [Acidobacteria bacterium]|nr:signal peptidase II [Acidobacteriota bacterium]